MQEADYGQTAMAMAGQNGRHQGDENLLVRFYMHPAQDKSASLEEGRPIFKDVPFVHIMQPGNKESIIHRKATSMDITRFAEHYRKFEAREDQDVISGTPIIEWPGVSRAQAEELKFFNVVSVEQLAGMSDTNTQNFRGMGELKRRAQAFLDISKDNAGATALAASEKRTEELEAIVKDMAARLGELEEDAPAAKSKRRKKAA